MELGSLAAVILAAAPTAGRPGPPGPPGRARPSIARPRAQDCGRPGNAQPHSPTVPMLRPGLGCQPRGNQAPVLRGRQVLPTVSQPGPRSSWVPDASRRAGRGGGRGGTDAQRRELRHAHPSPAASVPDLERGRGDNVPGRHPGAPQDRRLHPGRGAPPPCVRALRRHRAQQASDRLAAGDLWADSGLVFTARKGTPIEPRNINRTFDALVKRAGVQRIRFMTSDIPAPRSCK